VQFVCPFVIQKSDWGYQAQSWRFHEKENWQTGKAKAPRPPRNTERSRKATQECEKKEERTRANPLD
jgi:hypothetical protein